MIPPVGIDPIIDQIVGELSAQLDDLSDDTMALMDDAETSDAAVLLALAEDLRLTLVATIDQRVSDWRADRGI